MRLFDALRVLKARWIDVGIVIGIVTINLIILGQAGLAYGSYDWMRYAPSPYGPPSGYGGTAWDADGRPYIYGAFVPWAPYEPYGSYGIYDAGWMGYLAPSQPSTISSSIVACKPAPILFDPPEGKSFSARNTILRWRTDYALEPDEVFDALVWPAGSEDQVSIGKTRDKTLPVDFVQWNHASVVGKFFWTVRIRRLDGAYISCPTPPFSFVLGGLEGPHDPEKPPVYAPVQPKPGK